MNISFLFNVLAPLALLLFPIAFSLYRRRAKALENRLAILGLILSISLITHNFPHVYFLLPFMSALSSWICMFLCVSFVIELTGTQRPRFFFLVYGLSLPLALCTSVISNPALSAICIGTGAVLLSAFVLYRIAKWSFTSVREHSSEDAHWFLIIFGMGTVGVLISVMNGGTGTFWALTLLYFSLFCALTLRKSQSVLSVTDNGMMRQLMTEIADHEYATRELELLKNKFSRMFLFNPTGILIFDLKTNKITEVNPAIEEIFERDSTSLIGKTPGEIGFMMEEMPFETFYEKILIEGSISEFSATIPIAPGRIKKCHLSAVSYDIHGDGFSILSVVDVTRYEMLNDALAKRQKVETVGLLAGGIAHDFNNILSVILGHIGLAKMRTVDLHARVPIEKAEQACLRAREITGQLLVFSRGGKPILSRCDIQSIIVDSAILSASDSTVTCVYDIQKDIWPMKADRIQIGQVIANLVGNAVQAMDKVGSIEIRARNRDFTQVPPFQRPAGLDAKPLAAGKYVEVSVQDYGFGISPEIRPKIFDPFFTTKANGTGLGLSIVYSIVQNHLGTIVVDSQVGEGSTFSIYIPADLSPIQTPIVDSVSTPLQGVQKLPMEKRKVLVLDDDSLVRESLSLMLSSFGYEVVRAEEGREAAGKYRVDYLAGKPFAFGILDLVIENGASGVDCAKEILALDPAAVLIVSSGYFDDPVLAHYQDYGFKGSIPKPYSVSELQSALVEMNV